MLHEARCHARSGLPRSTRCHVISRFRTRYRAAPSRTAQSITSGTRRALECHMLHARTGTNALVATCAHPVDHISEPYQAHASHGAARIGSSSATGRVSVFVSVRVDSTDRCFGARMNGSDAPDACVHFCALNSNLITKTLNIRTSCVYVLFLCLLFHFLNVSTI